MKLLMKRAFTVVLAAVLLFGCGESEPQTALTAVLFRSAGQTLKDRIVFAVNGQHHCSVFAHGLLKQLSAANQKAVVWLPIR